MQVGVTPPSTLGVLEIVQSLRPGSTRSGEKARKKLAPTSRLLGDFSIRRGSNRSSVEPGYVVLSRTTSMPSRSRGDMQRAADAMYETSGSLVLLSGVGTHISTASESATTS